MKTKNYLKLINDGLIDEFCKNVFDNRLNSAGTSSYTDPLGEDAEVAIITKTLMLNGKDAGPWLEFIQKYNTKYPFCNKAINVLFENSDNPKSLPLLFDLLSSFGYNESQGVQLCKIMLQSKNQNLVVRLSRLLCEKGHIFYSEIYRLLEKLDIRIKDAKDIEPTNFAESYKQSILNYRKANNLERFYNF